MGLRGYPGMMGPKGEAVSTASRCPLLLPVLILG